MVNAAWLVLAAVTLSAGGNAVASDSLDQYREIHSVSVISNLGNDIEARNIGITVFSNSHHVLRLDWDINAFVVQEITALLGTRFSTVASHVDATSFSDPDVITGRLFTPAQTGPALPGSGGPDAYVVVYPQSLPGNQAPAVSLTHQEGMFGHDETTLVVAYHVSVFDGRTGTRMDYGPAKYPSPDPLLKNTYPHMECQNSIWAPTAEETTEQQKEIIKHVISTMIDRSIPYALSAAKLIPEDVAETASQRAATAAAARSLPCQQF
jgi:hypothetical protein